MLVFRRAWVRHERVTQPHGGAHVVEVVVEGPDVAIAQGVAVGAQDGRERAELQPCTRRSRSRGA